jgi:hypothetical protein
MGSIQKKITYIVDLLVQVRYLLPEAFLEIAVS